MTYSNPIGLTIVAGGTYYEIVPPNPGEHGEYGLKMKDSTIVYHSSMYTANYFNNNVGRGAWKVQEEPVYEIF